MVKNYFKAFKWLLTSVDDVNQLFSISLQIELENENEGKPVRVAILREYKWCSNRFDLLLWSLQ